MPFSRAATAGLTLGDLFLGPGLDPAAGVPGRDRPHLAEHARRRQEGGRGRAAHGSGARGLHLLPGRGRGRQTTTYTGPIAELVH
jgi:hypothetical protein